MAEAARCRHYVGFVRTLRYPVSCRPARPLESPVNDTLAFLRANPVVIGVLIFVAITALVLSVGAFLMSRAGVSLRPIAFMIVFLGIVAGPQIAFHLAQAFGVIPKRNLTWTFGKDRPHPGWSEREDVLAAQDGRFADPEAVFGKGIDRDLVSDAPFTVVDERGRWCRSSPTATRSTCRR